MTLTKNLPTPATCDHALFKVRIITYLYYGLSVVSPELSSKLPFNHKSDFTLDNQIPAKEANLPEIHMPHFISG